MNRNIGTQLKDALIRAANPSNPKGAWLYDLIHPPKHQKKVLQRPSRVVFDR
ncbi:MAG: hypothetical protein H8D97_01270 [Proteobacteria bacterium]|nr:hypothetical protein [Pseudomonadota bacterium]